MSSRKKSEKTKNNETINKIAKQMINTGIVLVFVSLAIFIFIFAPVLKEEIKYMGRTATNLSQDEVVYEDEYDEASKLAEEFFGEKTIPADENFSIIVPKIRANAKVIENVDPYNSAEYQLKLTEGVAHARGTSLPGEPGNTFLFAHSSDNFYNANRYNSVFYLLNKMDYDDVFYLIKDKTMYEYSVTEKSVVEPDQVQYLTDKSLDQKATLMTCWPPGTTLKRLILVGDLVSVSKP
jgi:sortase A